MSRATNPFLAIVEANKARRKALDNDGEQPVGASSANSNPFLQIVRQNQARRQREAKEEEERLYNEVYNAPPEEFEDEGDNRNWLSRAYDQINIFDGGRSWGQHKGDDSKSALEQGVEFGSNIFEGTAQGINTVAEGGRLVGELAKIGTAKATGNQDAMWEAIRRAESDEESLLEEGRGIGGKGGWVDREESANMSPADLAKNIAGASLKTGSEIVPLGRGARALTAARAGNVAGTTARVAGEGAIAGSAYGAGRGILEDDVNFKDIAIGGLLGGALGGIMGNIGGRMATRKADSLKRQADSKMMGDVDASANQAATYMDGEDVTRSMMSPQRQLLLGDGSENISRRIKDLDDELASLGEGSTFRPSQGSGVETRTLRDTQSIIEETRPGPKGTKIYRSSVDGGKPKDGVLWYSENKGTASTFGEANSRRTGKKSSIETFDYSPTNPIDFQNPNPQTIDFVNTVLARDAIGDYGGGRFSPQEKAKRALANLTQTDKQKIAKAAKEAGYDSMVFGDAGNPNIRNIAILDQKKASPYTGKTEVGQYGPEKILDEFIIDGGGGTTSVTPGSFQNNASRIKEIKRERATLQNELDSLKVQKEIEPNYNPKTTETVITKAAKNAENAKQVNDNMKFTDYKGRITDNLSSFFKALEGKLESTGGGRLMTNYYQRIVGGVASRNETQKVMARTLNSKMESVVGKLSNRAKRKMGTKVGDTLRKVSDEDMAELTVSQISSKYGVDTKTVQIAKVLRQHFKDLLEETNKVRLERGQDAIPYRSEYMPQWSKNRITDGAGRGASTADEKFNPFAQTRNRSNTDFEKNVFKTLDQYHRYASNELHLTPVVRDLRKTSAQLREAGNENGATFLDDFIDTAILKNRTAGWDKAWGITEGSMRQRVLQRISMARSLSGLAGNLRWMFITQPQSLGVTVGKFGPINTAKGMLDFVTDSALRKEIRELPMYRLKRSQSVGATAGGQLDRVSDSVLKSRREFANDVMGLPANFIEQTLDGMSAAAARRNAMGHMRNGKMTKEGMKNFMQHGIEVTQSVYSAEARPMVLQNLMARSAFPFQTYSVEMWRHLNNIGRGKGAGWNQTGIDRARQATVMVSAIVLGNALQKQATGQDIATPGSVVPFVGSQVNQGIDWATAMFGEGTDFASGGGAGLTSFERDLGDFAGIAGDLSDSFKGDGDLPVGFSEGLEDYLNTGKADKFRKILTRWGMGLAGIGGASTVNRMMDMAIDFNNEAIKTSKGRDIPFERTAGNVLTSGFLGRGALPEVEEFYGPQGANQFTEKEWQMVNIVPEEQRDAYSAFFGSTKDDPAKKSITAKRIRDAVADRNLEKARRLAAQYNRSMADKIGMLEGEVGKIDKIMLDYLSTYMIDFDYYKRQYDKK